MLSRIVICEPGPDDSAKQTHPTPCTRTERRTPRGCLLTGLLIDPAGIHRQRAVMLELAIAKGRRG